MSNKENDASLISETFVKLDVEEETRDFLFGQRFEATREKVTNWSTTKVGTVHYDIFFSFSVSWNQSCGLISRC